MDKEEIKMGCKFALGRLMPEAQVKRICGEFETKTRRSIRQNSGMIISLICTKFSVPRELAAARLIGLKLID